MSEGTQISHGTGTPQIRLFGGGGSLCGGPISGTDYVRVGGGKKSVAGVGASAGYLWSQCAGANIDTPLN